MKKIVTLILAGLITSSASAQDNYPRIDGEVFRTVAVLFVLLAFMFFIISILKRIFEYRLKNKIVEKGIAENIASSILQTDARENKDSNIKWAAILAGLGAGLTLINYTMPLGIHSLAIMSFCIALSFLGYFLYLKSSGK
ncbi:hypothetical protein [Terrimonas alba]|uniref:hypothetical protein n=1 Tax=Terrimonas alba TaxID=3349636 RepID=UPI0035F4DB7B